MICRQQLFYEKGKIRTLTFLSSTSKLDDHSSFAEENHLTQMYSKYSNSLLLGHDSQMHMGFLGDAC